MNKSEQEDHDHLVKAVKKLLAAHRIWERLPDKTHAKAMNREFAAVRGIVRSDEPQVVKEAEDSEAQYDQLPPDAVVPQYQEDTPIEGWWTPPKGRKQHYFRARESLCGQRKAEGDIDLSPEPRDINACTICAEMREAELADG